MQRIVLFLAAMALRDIESLSLQLDYQQVNYNNSNGNDLLVLGITVSGGNCGLLRVEYFLKRDSEMEVILHKRLHFPASEKIISVPVKEFNDDRMYFRVVAVESSDSQTICSDYYSLHTFYRFSENTGIEVHYSSTMISLPIPSSDLCEYLTLVFPRPSHPTQGPCYCPATTYGFNDCAEYCTGDKNIRIVDNSVVFTDISMYYTEAVLVHFICDTNICLRDDCFLKSVVTSHRLITGTNNAIGNNTEVYSEYTATTSPPLLNETESIVIYSVWSGVALGLIIIISAITVCVYKVRQRSTERAYVNM